MNDRQGQFDASTKTYRHLMETIARVAVKQITIDGKRHNIGSDDENLKRVWATLSRAVPFCIPADVATRVYREADADMGAMFFARHPDLPAKPDREMSAIGGGVWRSNLDRVATYLGQKARAGISVQLKERMREAGEPVDGMRQAYGLTQSVQALLKEDGGVGKAAKVFSDVEAAAIAHVDADITAVKWPGAAPFPVIFFLYGTGVRMTAEEGIDEAAFLDLDPEEEEELTKGNTRIVGSLVDIEAMRAWDVYDWEGTKTNEHGEVLGHYKLAAVRRTDDDGENRWTDSLLRLGPWTLPRLIDIATTFRTRALKSPSLTVQRVLSKVGVKRLPPPLYRLDITPTTYSARRRSVRIAEEQARRLAYRHDVRAHDRVLVMRGQVPISEATETKLLARGYEVHRTPTTLTTQIRQALFLRDIPGVRPGEWIAIRIVRVRSHQRGPEGQPYIPAMRVVRSA